MGRPRHPEPLTPAEQRVLDAIEAGKSNSEIAVSLGISMNTVRYHVKNIRGKLGESEHAAPAGVTNSRGGWWRWGAGLAAGLGIAGVAAVGLVVAAAFARDTDEPPVTSSAAEDGLMPDRLNVTQLPFGPLIVVSEPVGDATYRLVAVAEDGERFDLTGEVKGSIGDLVPSPDRTQFAATVSERQCFASQPSCGPPDAGAPTRFDMASGEIEPLGSGFLLSEQLSWDDSGRVVIAVDTPLYPIAITSPRARMTDPLPVGCRTPAASPDERFVTCTTGGLDASPVVMHIARSMHDIDAGGPEWRILLPGRGVIYPAFSPDGRWLAWTNDDSSRHSIWLLAIPAAEPGTGTLEPIRLETGQLMTWSPDSTRLAFELMSADPLSRETSLAYYDLQSGLAFVNSSAGNEQLLQWSADGQQLAFVSDAGIFATEMDLATYHRIGDASGSFAWVTR